MLNLNCGSTQVSLTNVKRRLLRTKWPVCSCSVNFAV
uniref:Uncharacterized protein n=1 Tax=Arundo donax TaxID=35708 RepID=A0A0A8YFC2_ARUDO